MSTQGGTEEITEEDDKVTEAPPVPTPATSTLEVPADIQDLQQRFVESGRDI